MERFLESIFDQFLKELCGEGERRVKLQALSACFSALQGTRKLIIAAYFFSFACFLSALSFFGMAFCLFDQLHAGSVFGQGFQWREPKLIFTASLFALSTGLLALTVREKFWLGAFGIREKIAELEAANSRAKSSGISEADLVSLINRVLDQRSVDQRARDRHGSNTPDQAA